MRDGFLADVDDVVVLVELLHRPVETLDETCRGSEEIVRDREGHGR